MLISARDGENLVEEWIEASWNTGTLEHQMQY
jgi:hypothetical protein